MTVTSVGITIFLLINADVQSKHDCIQSVYLSYMIGNPVQLLFRALPSLLVMYSHVKNYRPATHQSVPEIYTEHLQTTPTYSNIDSDSHYSVTSLTDR